VEDISLIEDADLSGRACASPDLLDDGPVEEFSEEEVVGLHWWLLRKVRLLEIPSTPLAEKFELVRWVFTDPVHDRQPFSFVNCLRVVACSPLSRLPYVGACDPEEVRDWIAAHLRRWFEASLACYPAWVRHAVMSNPEWVADHLAANPQWINEQMRRHEERGDLFALVEAA
jgi:hypothetical protein